ncbi:hypothetical protein GGF32_002017 [Allomyces javanicus]|nr:hypothetical protein GGF32_002017 [Allomyces javanicus]
MNFGIERRLEYTIEEQATLDPLKAAYTDLQTALASHPGDVPDRAELLHLHAMAAQVAHRKFRMVATMESGEQHAEYGHLRSTDEAKRATQAELDALIARRAELEQQLHRKIEYEAIMVDVRKTPSRAALQVQTNDLELAIAALRQRLVDQTQHAAERRAELQRALRAVAGVRDGVREEMAARAEMQRELAAEVAAAAGRPGSTAPGTPAAAAGGAHPRTHTGAEEGEIGGRRG